MFIRSVIKNRILRLTFADPATRNSFSLRAAEELVTSLEKHQGQFDAVCLQAEGRVFCSGGNLADYGQMTDGDEGRRVNRRITEVLKTLETFPVPTFCLVEGDCFGGGVELMSAFDFVYAVPHAFFGLWQKRVGLTFGWGGGARLAKRLGETRLKQLAISTETFSAFEAHDLGLIDAVTRDPLQLFTQKWSQMSRHPLSPVSGFKRFPTENEGAIFDEYWWGDEHRSRLSARAKREN